MLANRLTHRCTIQRHGEPTGSWHTTPGAWDDHLTDVPCRLWATAGREVVENPGTVAAVDDFRLLCALDTDVTEDDRLCDVTDRGATILAGPTSIRAVLRHQGHMELVLVKAAA